MGGTFLDRKSAKTIQRSLSAQLDAVFQRAENSVRCFCRFSGSTMQSFLYCRNQFLLIRFFPPLLWGYCLSFLSNVLVAVRVGFEPTDLLQSLVFKTSAISQLGHRTT